MVLLGVTIVMAISMGNAAGIVVATRAANTI